MPARRAKRCSTARSKSHDVPAGQHVGIDGAHVGEEALEERALVRHDLGARDRRARRRCSTRSPPVPAIGDRVERSPSRLVSMSSDSTRRRGVEVARARARIAVDAADAGPPLVRAVDRERAADAAVDQVAIREAEVGLEALDARVVEAARGAAARPRERAARRATTGSPAKRRERGLGHGAAPRHRPAPDRRVRARARRSTAARGRRR